MFTHFMNEETYAGLSVGLFLSLDATYSLSRENTDIGLRVNHAIPSIDLEVTHVETNIPHGYVEVKIENLGTSPTLTPRCIAQGEFYDDMRLRIVNIMGYTREINLDGGMHGGQAFNYQVPVHFINPYGDENIRYWIEAYSPCSEDYELNRRNNIMDRILE